MKKFNEVFDNYDTYLGTGWACRDCGTIAVDDMMNGLVSVGVADASGNITTPITKDSYAVAERHAYDHISGPACQDCYGTYMAALEKAAVANGYVI